MAVWNSNTHRWEQAGVLAPMIGPLGKRHVPDQETLARPSAKACLRRIVLLPINGDLHGPHEVVLCQPDAHHVDVNLRRLADKHPGRVLAAEWLSSSGWKRWLWRIGESL